MRIGTGAIALLIAVSGACGSEAVPAGSPVTTPGLPATYTGPDGVTTEVTDVSRIVTLSGDFSEIVWDLGLGDNLVGVDLGSVFPKEEMRLKAKVGVEFRLLAEPILALQPTLVIGDIDASPAAVIEQVRGAGIPVVIFPRFAGLSAPGEKIRAVAALLGLAADGDAMALAVEQQIDEAVALAATTTQRPMVAVVYAIGATASVLNGETIEAVYRQTVEVVAHPVFGSPLILPYDR